MFIIGTGLTELHALIDLSNSINADRDTTAALIVTGFDVACHDGS